MKSKIFDNVYPFTTEEIASYFPLLALIHKKVWIPIWQVKIHIIN